MKILLIQPPHYYGNETRPPQYFPLGLGYVASAIKKNNHSIMILDIWAHQLSKEEVVERIKSIDYDICGISALTTQYSYIKWLADQLKTYSDNNIVLGGALATLSPDVVLKNTKVDICVIGEGEITFKELVENQNDPRSVKGIYFKTDGKIVKNLPRKHIENLDEIDFPAWDLFPLDIYLDNSYLYAHPEIKAMNVITSRGCPYNCRFCSKVFKGVRLRSVDNIIKEIKTLKKRYGVEGIYFVDELFVINKKRTLEFCDKIEPLDMKWNCQGRVNYMDHELLSRMKETGCIAVGYGLESGSQTILDNMNKKITTEQSISAIKNTFKAGIQPIPQAMFGYPGETKKTLRETVEFFKKLPFMGRINLSVTTPLPGTEIYEYALNHNMIQKEDEYFEQLSGGYMPDAERPLVNFTRFSDKEFYKIKSKTEKEIFTNQIARNLGSFLSFYFKGLIRYYQRKGLKEIIKRSLKEFRNLPTFK